MSFKSLTLLLPLTLAACAPALGSGEVDPIFKSGQTWTMSFLSAAGAFAGTPIDASMIVGARTRVGPDHFVYNNSTDRLLSLQSFTRFEYIPTGKYPEHIIAVETLSIFERYASDFCFARTSGRTKEASYPGLLLSTEAIGRLATERDLPQNIISKYLSDGSTEGQRTCTLAEKK
jgi:hypothetical protein